MGQTKAKLGKKIKKLRKLKGLTQESFAEILDISITAMSKIETGVSFPASETIEKISTALKVPLSELFTFEDSFSETDVYEQILHELNKVEKNPEKLNMILKIIKAVL